MISAFVFFFRDPRYSRPFAAEYLTIQTDGSEGRTENTRTRTSKSGYPKAGIVANMPAATVAEYLAALPADRRAALSAVRKVIDDNLPDGYEEGMQFAMIGWYVRLSLYPADYGENPKVPLPLVALASQKLGAVWHFISFPAIPLYWFASEY